MQFLNHTAPMRSHTDRAGQPAGAGPNRRQLAVCFWLQELSPKQYWEELMAVVTYWMAQESAATTGTVSVLRQVRHTPP